MPGEYSRPSIELKQISTPAIALEVGKRFDCTNWRFRAHCKTPQLSYNPQVKMKNVRMTKHEGMHVVS